MKSNIDVIEAFLNHENLGSLNLLSENDKLFSFDTCIAQWYDDELVINDTYYSPNMSKHVGLLKRLGQDFDIRFVTGVPLGRGFLVIF